VKKEIVAIDRSVDWHKPIVISQAGGTGKRSEKAASAKKAEKKPVTKKRAERETAVSKKAPVKKAAAKCAPTASNPKSAEAAHREGKVFDPLPFVSLVFGKDQVRIVTADEKIRAFHLNDPFKVVVDFKRDARFLTKHKTLDMPPYKAVDIGNHDGYYRVVVTFDAPYRYSLSKVADGYLIELR
jgi:hypothetical protein